jgi:hypothetical protein
MAAAATAALVARLVPVVKVAKAATVLTRGRLAARAAPVETRACRVTVARVAARAPVGPAVRPAPKVLLV